MRCFLIKFKEAIISQSHKNHAGESNIRKFLSERLNETLQNINNLT